VKSSESKLGLLAGAGKFPIYMSQVAKDQGYQVIVIGPEAKMEPGIEKFADKVRTYRFAKFREFLGAIEQEGIKTAVMAGKMDKRWLYQPDVQLDDLTVSLLKGLPDQKDDTIMLQIVHTLEEHGVEVLESVQLIKDWLAPEGAFSAREPDEKQKRDIAFGFRIAKEIGRLDVGQTVAVLDRAVLAVEAIDGTDLTILRAGQISAGAVVVKILKPGQSLKFDVPVVGKSTIQSMIQAHASVLAVEAGKCLVVEKEEMVALANQNKISLIGVKND
jgi:hypothetical protein